MKRASNLLMTALCLALILCLVGCSAAVEEAAPAADPTPGRTFAMGRTTPMPTFEHVTPAPLVTPRPTPTPEPTPDPTPLPTLVYSGTGDDVVELNMGDYPVIHFTSDYSGYCSVTGYDTNGEYSSLLISEIGDYDGVVTDFGFDIRTLEIKTGGSWSVEAYTYEGVPHVSDEYETSGDCVLSLDPTKRIAEISGNDDASFFSVSYLYYENGKRRTDLLVATTDPYSGRNLLHGMPLILQVDASGPWRVKLS